MKKQGFIQTTVLTLVALLGITSAMLAAFPGTAHAAGESYQWKDFQTITVTGGDLKGSNTLTMSTPPTPAGPPIDLGNGTTLPGAPATGGTFGGQFVYKDNCYITLVRVAINANNNGGVMTATPGSVAGSPGSMGPCSNNIINSYNRTNISIGGTRPSSGGAAETASQKSVRVSLYPGKTMDSAPASTVVTLKDAADKVISTVTVKQTPPNTNTGQPPSAQDAEYETTFSLNPGSYKVCEPLVIPGCQSFTKVKYQALQLRYGETASERNLIVTVHVTYTGGPKDMTVGPTEISLTGPDGAVSKAMTDSKEHKMTQAEKEQQGGFTVTYQFDLNATFRDLAPGQYKVCLTALNACKTVTKEAGRDAKVTLEADAIKLMAASSGNEELDVCTEAFSSGGTLLGAALTWAVCPIINNIINGAISGLDNAVTSMMTLDVDKIFDINGPYHKIWLGFRTFALALIVIAGLVMVISQAAGLEILSAYALRKIMPSVILAPIFIVVSWPVLEFILRLSNDVGNGVAYLVYSPFAGISSTGGVGAGTAGLAAMLSTGAAFAFGWIGLLSFALTGFVAVLMAYFLLTIRELVAILAVVLSPIAIACSIMPATQKVFGIWKVTITGVAVSFGLVMLVVYGGRAAAVVAFAEGSTISQGVALFLYIGGYIAIPKVLMAAGGVLGTITGMANDRSKGVFDRLSNYRSRTAATNFQKARVGERFKGKGTLSKGFNTATGTMGAFANAESKGAFLTNSKFRKESMQQFNAINAMNHANTDRGKVAQHNDSLLRAQSYDTRAAAKDNMAKDWGMSDEDVETALLAAEANGGWSKGKQESAVRRLFATGTGYDNEKQVIEAVHRFAGDNASMAASVLGEGNSTTKNAGRFDLAGGFQEHMALYTKVKGGGKLNEADIDNFNMQALEGNDAVSFLRGKPKGLKDNVLPSLRRSLETQQNKMINALDQTSKDAASREAGRLSGIIESLESTGSMYAAPQIKTIVNNTVYTPTAGTRDAVRNDVDPKTLRPNAQAAAGRYEQAPRGMYDPNNPNDPRNQA